MSWGTALRQLAMAPLCGLLLAASVARAETVDMRVRMERSDIGYYTIDDSGAALSVRGRPQTWGFPGVVAYDGIEYNVQSAYQFSGSGLSFHAYYGQNRLGTEPSRETYVFEGNSGSQSLRAVLKQYGSTAQEYILRGAFSSGEVFSMRISRQGQNWFQVSGTTLSLRVIVTDRGDVAMIDLRGSRQATPTAREQLALAGAALGFLWLEPPL